MKIVKVTDKELADACDEMLTSLIMDERKYDTNIKKDFVVNGWYSTTLDDKNRVTFAAVEEEKSVGFIHGFVKDEAGVTVNTTVLMLDAIYVNAQNRGKGIAKALIKEFKKWGKAVNAKYIDLTVLDDNYKAIELYEKLGFIPLKTYMRNKLE